MGTTVIGGMLAATLIAIFLIPVMDYVIERFATNRKQGRERRPARGWLKERTSNGNQKKRLAAIPRRIGFRRKVEENPSRRCYPLFT